MYYWFGFSRKKIYLFGMMVFCLLRLNVILSILGRLKKLLTFVNDILFNCIS